MALHGELARPRLKSVARIGYHLLQPPPLEYTWTHTHKRSNALAALGGRVCRLGSRGGSFSHIGNLVSEWWL